MTPLDSEAAASCGEASSPGLTSTGDTQVDSTSVMVQRETRVYRNHTELERRLTQYGQLSSAPDIGAPPLAGRMSTPYGQYVIRELSGMLRLKRGLLQPVETHSLPYRLARTLFLLQKTAIEDEVRLIEKKSLQRLKSSVLKSIETNEWHMWSDYTQVYPGQRFENYESDTTFWKVKLHPTPAKLPSGTGPYHLVLCSQDIDDLKGTYEDEDSFPLQSSFKGEEDHFLERYYIRIVNNWVDLSRSLIPALRSRKITIPTGAQSLDEVVRSIYKKLAGQFMHLRPIKMTEFLEERAEAWITEAEQQLFVPCVPQDDESTDPAESSIRPQLG